MKKVSTAVAKQGRNISRQTLTIGLDLGDRNSWYCVLDGIGSDTTGTASAYHGESVAGSVRPMPRSRVALETGRHSPWPEPTLPPRTREGWGNPLRNLDSERMGQPAILSEMGIFQHLLRRRLNCRLGLSIKIINVLFGKYPYFTFPALAVKQ